MIDIPRQSWTYLEFVRRRADQYGDRIFCTFSDGDILTFAEFETATNALASGLAGLGIDRGDRVVGMMYNSKAFLLAMVAVHKRGAIFVPINTELKGAFLEHQIRNIDPCAAFVGDELLPAFDTISIDGLNIEATVSIEGNGEPLTGSRAIAFADLLETQARAEDVVEAKAHDICMIMFTSGTTGPSKGTLMPHAHSVLFGFGAGRALKMTPEDCMFICMPFFHAMGLMLQLTSCLVYGSSAHVIRQQSNINVWPRCDSGVHLPPTAEPLRQRSQSTLYGRCPDWRRLGCPIRGTLWPASGAGLRHDRVQYTRLRQT